MSGLLGIVRPFEKATASTHWPIGVSPGPYVHLLVGTGDCHWLQSETGLQSFIFYLTKEQEGHGSIWGGRRGGQL